jgi:hypothetical protein
VAGALAVILASGTVAYAQGFMVKPMKMELTARPGQTVESVLELRNAGGDEAKTLELKLVELSQGPEGGWQIIEAGTPNETPSDFSCLKWIKLSAETVNVDPMKMAPVTVTVKTPAGARGFYLAGLIAQIKAKPAEKGVTVVIRFMIPILVEIEGRPERQKIDLNDVGMTFRKESPDSPPTALASLGVENSGKTYSRIKGSVKVMFSSNGRWKPVSTVEIRELGILPGSKLNLAADLQRRLPSGKYKLSGTLYVDGRRGKPLEKEIDFEGDPTVTRLAVDTPLTIDPLETLIAGAPGSSRTATIKVENASDDEVTVEAACLTPALLRGVAMGDLKGDDLSCASWVEVIPAKFTLRAGAKQNIRVVAKMPKDDNPQANYYGTISLKATYPDGQNAGQGDATVCVGNKGVEAKPAAQVAKMTLAAAESGKYVLQARFANSGNVHFKPKCKAVVVTGQGQTVTETELAGEEGIMLPLESREFSGIVDFGKIEPGAYALKAVLEFAPGQGAAEQLPIRVTVEDGQKVVTIITPEAASSSAPASQPGGNAK